jgi:hypothetical protein
VEPHARPKEPAWINEPVDSATAPIHPPLTHVSKNATRVSFVIAAGA